jgi:hypothetical protein
VTLDVLGPHRRSRRLQLDRYATDGNRSVFPGQALNGQVSHLVRRLGDRKGAKTIDAAAYRLNGLAMDATDREAES